MKNPQSQTIKKFLIELLIGAVLIVAASNTISYLRQPRLQDKKLPLLTLLTIDGGQIKLQDYRGKPLLIHFWATWCPVCKAEMSVIDRMSQKYQVITVAVTSGSDAEIRAFLREHKTSFGVVNDSQGDLAKDFSVEVFPTTFIYDGNSELVFSEVGYTSTIGLFIRMIWAG